MGCYSTTCLETVPFQTRSTANVNTRSDPPQPLDDRAAEDDSDWWPVDRSFRLSHPDPHEPGQQRGMKLDTVTKETAIVRMRPQTEHA
jgi:hypothetical protein